jgi:hypothetical protein
MIASRELDSWMNSLGGKKIASDEGEEWLFIEGEFQVEMEPGFRNSKGTVTVGVDVSISHSELSGIATLITGKKLGTRQQLEWHQSSEDIPEDDDVSGTLRRVVTRELLRVRSLNLRSIIDSFAAPGPPPVRSLDQIVHLAALAYKADIYRLTEYLEGMKRGKRFGLVPMITPEMVDRAIEIAAR